MNKEKIALLMDSGADIPANYREKNNVFLLPLRIIFDDAEYIDKVNITANELFKRMEEQIPSTSLPTGEDILEKIKQIRDHGFQKIIAITISSALSGTYTAVKNIISEYANDLETFVLDTKNISIGTGLSIIAAQKAIDAGETFTNITKMLTKKVKETKIFFTVGNLEYLQKGGRISNFAALLSGVFNIKPIITCDDEGLYALVGKERGKKRSYDRLISMTQNYIANGRKPYTLAIVYGESLTDFEAFKANALATFTDAKDVIYVPVSPALGVHTGPDAMGIAVQLLS